MPGAFGYFEVFDGILKIFWQRVRGIVFFVLWERLPDAGAPLFDPAQKRRKKRRKKPPPIPMRWTHGHGPAGPLEPRSYNVAPHRSKCFLHKGPSNGYMR